MIVLLLLSCTSDKQQDDSAFFDSGDDVVDTAMDDIDTGVVDDSECGNSIVEEGEVCDDGNEDEFDACGFSCSVIHQNQSYTAHDQVITNPERGFYRQDSFIIGGASEDISDDLARYKEEGLSLVLLMFDLRDYVFSDIDQAALDEIGSYFQQVRAAGLKAIVRFRYTNEDEGEMDATPARTFLHIQSLQSTLIDNSDVIFVLQAGFIGKHGEWYQTDNWGDSGAWTEQDTSNRTELVNKMLDSLAFGRSVQLRTPFYRTDMFGDAHSCHDGSSLSRLGVFNDCFLASDTDVGTYRESSDRDWLVEDSRCTPVGGETCRVYAPRSECDSALQEMEELHWTFLNAGYNPEVLESWDDTITTSLVPRESVWKYHDFGMDLGTEWIQSGYDDSGWSSGQAELGYGDGDENTVVLYGGDASNKHITTYFRHTFTVDSTAEDGTLQVELKMDDGAVVYLNGTEVVRSNMPQGEILFDTLAGENSVSESAFFHHPIDSSLLNVGENVLAVEVHQISESSSDISFDMRLTRNTVNESIGCMTEVKRRLGYRLALKDSLLPQQAPQGSAIGIDINIQNLGFAAPVNPRDVVLSLVSQEDESRWSIALDTDPRQWLPNEESWNIRQTVGLPEDIPPGEYSWVLTLPDPTEDLRDRGGYGIQLANEGLWDETLFEHTLGQGLLVTEYGLRTPYEGERRFEQ